MRRFLMVCLPVFCIFTYIPNLAAADPYPVLTVTVENNGIWTFIGLDSPWLELNVDGDDPDLELSLIGDACGYGGTIIGYRYGWDLTDLSDWLVPFD